VVGPALFHVQKVPTGGLNSMITIAFLATLAVVSTLLVAALVVVFVAYPLRHRAVPYAPWLSPPLERIRDNIDPLAEWSHNRPATPPGSDDTVDEPREHHAST
jgi:hypothetical protein